MSKEQQQKAPSRVVFARAVYLPSTTMTGYTSASWSEGDGGSTVEVRDALGIVWRAGSTTVLVPWSNIVEVRWT